MIGGLGDLAGRARTAWRERARVRALRRWLPRLALPAITGGRQQTLVFNTVRSNPGSFHLYTDLFIAHLLARCGCRAVVLLDDGALAHWDTVQKYRTAAAVLNPMHTEPQARAMRHHVQALFDVFETPGLELLWYSAFLDGAGDEALAEDNERYATASTLRHFESGVLRLQDPVQRAYLQLSRRNAQVSQAVGRRVVEALRPDGFFTSHGIYSTWGPAYGVVKRAGIRTAVYAHHPYHLGGFMIDDAPGGSLDHKALERYLGTAAFPDAHRARSQRYLDARLAHQTSDTQEYFGAEPGRQVRPSGATAGEYECTFGLFPNVVWDAIGDHLAPIFPSVIEWICETVRLIGQARRHRLVIRFHPAEVTRMKGTLGAEQLVRERVPEIDDYPNLTLIGAADSTNSYALLRDEVDVALVYTGTLGAEAQPLGVPVVAAASGRFSQRFVYLAPDIDAYRSTLHDPAPLRAAFDRDRDRIVEDVLKYHYYLSEELFFPVPLLSRHARRVAEAGELRDLTALEVAGLERTLRRYLVAE